MFAVGNKMSIHGYGRYQKFGVEGAVKGACELYLTITVAGALSRKLVWTNIQVFCIIPG